MQGSGFSSKRITMWLQLQIFNYNGTISFPQLIYYCWHVTNWWWLSLLFWTLKNYFKLCVCVLVPMRTVPLEARRRHLFSWSCSYRQLRTTWHMSNCKISICALTNELSPLANLAHFGFFSFYFMYMVFYLHVSLWIQEGVRNFKQLWATT